MCLNTFFFLPKYEDPTVYIPFTFVVFYKISIHRKVDWKLDVVNLKWDVVSQAI